jgi:hypothetical protein
MHPNLQDRLYVPAIDAVTIRLEHVLSQGWSMHLAHRHSGEAWETCSVDSYTGCTPEELVQVLDAALSALWGL